MTNQLNMVRIEDILRLCEQKLSHRKVAKLLGVHRHTVSRYVRQSEAAASALPPAETGNGEPSKSTISPLGNSAGRKSDCEPLRSVIEPKLAAGLSAQRIYQDLKFEHGFTGSYCSVKRFARRCGATAPLPFRRMECEPGAEAQVDFGKEAPVLLADGKKRYPHVFRLTLSFSRKGYSEAVWRQDTETFLRCLENAFRYLGGVPRTLIPDNLKAAVLHPDWYDPELNPKLQSFCTHYGTVLLPTKPFCPRHKGKTERQIGYVQNNALKDRQFGGLRPYNDHLLHWEETVADLRIHGTTRRQVKELFETVEKPALLPLPPDLFPFFHEGQRTVHRDGHVEVEKAYYSVPPEYLGHTVWVRYDARLVRVFDQRLKQIAVHSRAEPGKFRTEPVHIPKEKIAGAERGADYHLRRTQLIGPWSHLWARTMLQERGVAGVRVLVGFVALTHHHSDLALETASQAALRHGCFHLRSVRHLLTEPARQGELEFMDRHPLIRDLAEYQAFVNQIAPHDGGSSLPSFYSGETNHEGHTAVDAQTTAALGPGGQPGSPSARGLGESIEP